MTSPSPNLLAERYGARRPVRRRLVVLLAAVLAAAGLAWVAWAAWVQGNPDVQSGMVRSRIVDEHHATAVIAVSFRTSHIVAHCLLQAQASDHSVVGELNLKVGPAPDRRLTVRASMRTERRAVVVDLVGCTTPQQRRPR